MIETKERILGNLVEKPINTLEHIITNNYNNRNTLRATSLQSYETKPSGLHNRVHSLEDLGRILRNYKTPQSQQRTVLQQGRKVGNLTNYENVSFSQVRQKLEEEITVDHIPDKFIGNDSSGNYLNKLMNFNFAFPDQLNQRVSKFKKAFRIDILREMNYKMIKNPFAMITVLKYLSEITGKQIGFGLKHVPDRGKCEYVPFTIEYDRDTTDGIFYIDQKRPLAVKNILTIEKIVKKTNLSGAKIIANKVGLPSKKFVERLNLEATTPNTFEVMQYDSIIKKIGIISH